MLYIDENRPSFANSEYSFATEPSRDTFVYHTSITRGGQIVINSKGPMMRLIQRIDLERFEAWVLIFSPRSRKERLKCTFVMT